MHVLKNTPAAGKLASLHHDHVVRGLDNLPWETLLARFAWNMLLLLIEPFVEEAVRRARLRVHVVDGPAQERTAESATAKQLRNLYAGGGNRSASPVKRKRSDDEDGAKDDCVHENLADEASEGRRQ